MEDIDYTLKEILPENIETTLVLRVKVLGPWHCRSSLYCCIEAARQCEIFLARDVSGPGGGLQGLKDAVAPLFLA